MCRIGTILCGAALIASTTAAIGGTVQTPQEPPKKNVIQQPLVVPHVQQPLIQPQQVIRQPVVTNPGQKGQVTAPYHNQPAANQVPTFSPSFQTGGQTTPATVGSPAIVGAVPPPIPGRLNFAPVGQSSSYTGTSTISGPSSYTGPSSYPGQSNITGPSSSAGSGGYTTSTPTTYIQSGTGAQLTAAQINGRSFPAGTFFIESGTGNTVTADQLKSAPASVPQPTHSSSSPILPAPTGQVVSARIPIGQVPIPASSNNSKIYVQSGTGTQLTADQIKTGSFPSGTFFVDSTTGQQVSQQQLQGSVPSVPLSALPQIGLYPDSNSGSGRVVGPPLQLTPSVFPPQGSSGIANTTPAVTSTQQRSAPAANTVSGLSVPTSRGVVFMDPVLPRTPTNTANCVLFLSKDLGVQLPSGLNSFNDKQKIINVSGAPQKGDVAIIKVNSGPFANDGHVALVTDVGSNSITITEAHWKGNIADSRIATGTSLQDAQNQLNIVGYYRP